MTGMPRSLRRSAWLVTAVLAAAAVGCTPNRPPPAPRPVLPWGAVDLAGEPAAVRMPEGPVALLPGDEALVDQLTLNDEGVYEYPVLSISGGGSHGAWGAGFLVGWSEAGTRPTFRIVTGMSAGALLATPAFLGSDYDAVLTTLFAEKGQDDFFTLGVGSITRGLLGAGHFANFGPGRDLLNSLISDEVIDAVGEAYQAGRRLYVATANFDDNVWTVWDLGAIATSGEPDRYDRYRDVIAAAVAVPGGFPPVYFPVEVDGETYGQMHLDAGTNFVYLDTFMFGGDAQIVAEAKLQTDVLPVLYVIMNTQREPAFRGPPSGAPIELVGRAYQRIGRFASYGALDRLWIGAIERDVRVQIARIPDDLVIPFDVFEFPQPEMREVFDAGRAAATAYVFEERPPDIRAPEDDPENPETTAAAATP